MAELRLRAPMLGLSGGLSWGYASTLCAIFLLLLSPPAAAKTFIVKVSSTGPGRVVACDGTKIKGGSLKVEEGQNACLSMKPGSAAFETKNVKIDGKALGPLSDYTFPVVAANHSVKAVFVWKSLAIRAENLNPSGGKLVPRKSFKIPFGLSRTFVARPKKGFVAALRVDGVEMVRGKANQSIRYRLKNVEVPHTVEVQFLRFDPVPRASAALTVRVEASDPNGWPLHYQWRVSEGDIVDVDAPATTWHLPPGPGVHFANVQVSNGHGGYVERRIAVVSDDFGFASPASSPRDFAPPALSGKQFFNDAELLVVNQPGASRSVYLPGLAASYADPFNGITINTATDAYGWLSFFNFGHCTLFCDGDLMGHPHTHELLSEYVVGSARLTDGRPCGAENPFQGTHISASAQLLDGNQQPLGEMAHANAYGDYALPWHAQAAFVRVECEAAAPVVVSIDGFSRVAEKAVFAATAAPDVTGMSADYEWPNVGIFLPPELGQPSDRFSRTDSFLAFKGIDDAASACEYYRVIGAVQNCDAQGRPSGAITFDDWKRKTGMAPYVRSGGKEIQATYINRIDLNLTRNHHGISYPDDATRQISAISAGGYHNCGLRADGSLVCWGTNDSGEASPPSGSFNQVSAGISYSCAVKSDKSLICWGEGSFAQVTPPAVGSYTQVSVGNMLACAINSSGNLACWGDQSLVQTTPAGVYTQVSIGDAHACALRKSDGRLVCWESVSAGQTSEPAGPVKGPNGDGGSYQQVSAGGAHTCGLKTDRSIKCWGSSGAEPISFPNGLYNQVSVGSNHACALKADQTVLCRGANDLGQSTPPPGVFSQVSAGSVHTCALNADGEIRCWGEEYNNKTNPPDYRHQSAAYVCNHLGPKSDSQADIDAAIANALAGRNQVACVAMDFGYATAAGNPYVRYLTFAPNGQLLLSLNLDGRSEKFMPGVCVACHGGDKYDVRFPQPVSAPGRSVVGSPDYGGHFLPWDIGNFEFSTQPGLTKADQQAAIRQLNQIVMATNPTTIERKLISGWYAAGSDAQDEEYWPDTWKTVAASGSAPGVDVEQVYKKVYARYCRTCHIALTRDGSGTSSTDNPDLWANWSNVNFAPTLCGGSRSIKRNHTMPNSLRTFDLFWNDAQAQALLAQVFPGACLDNPDPEVEVPQVPESLGGGRVVANLSGAAGSEKFYGINVPAGKTLTVKLEPDPNVVNPNPGSAAFSVRKERLPSAYINDCAQATVGDCSQFTSAAATRYYIVVYGYSAYSGWNLTVSYQ